MHVMQWHEGDTLTLDTQYGMRLRLTHTPTGEIEVERLDDGVLTAVPLSRSVIMLLSLPVSPAQKEF